MSLPSKCPLNFVGERDRPFPTKVLTLQMETLKGDKLSKDLITKLKDEGPRKEVDGKKKESETNKERKKRDEKWKRTSLKT